MNETLSVYLNLNMEEEDEALIERIDQLLLMVGLKDSGMGNIYVPEDWKIGTRLFSVGSSYYERQSG